ncbi:MAG: hypothetical protein WC376_04450 [Candidatus Nanoarchaeia archaeon]|jgi:hypothetical protein
MKKSQELSLNMIVIGALALLVFLIIGGVLIFSGGDILGSLQGMGASQDEVAVTTFKSTCASKCRILQQLAPPTSGTIDENQMNQIKAYCCENYDLNSNSNIEDSTTLGPEYCAKAYTECKISGKTPSQFCKGKYYKTIYNPVCPTCEPTYDETKFDFTVTAQSYTDTSFDIVEGCGI